MPHTAVPSGAAPSQRPGFCCNDGACRCSPAKSTRQAHREPRRAIAAVVGEARLSPVRWAFKPKGRKPRADSSGWLAPRVRLDGLRSIESDLHLSNRARLASFPARCGRQLPSSGGGPCLRPGGPARPPGALPKGGGGEQSETNPRRLRERCARQQDMVAYNFWTGMHAAHRLEAMLGIAVLYDLCICVRCAIIQTVSCTSLWLLAVLGGCSLWLLGWPAGQHRRPDSTPCLSDHTHSGRATGSSMLLHRRPPPHTLEHATSRCVSSRLAAGDTPPTEQSNRPPSRRKPARTTSQGKTELKGARQPRRRPS